ncbi:Hypp7332 [Branchiostoma lanceolatum]|uniref:Hypp7332 protein n=1 Tax=Branchiostoma lanceolatum TaxID=7740 RepID=A0A8J9YZ29_BRALA|nr:Hypp7332 [Branchiostoma lanceolatum]
MGPGLRVAYVNKNMDVSYEAKKKRARALRETVEREQRKLQEAERETLRLFPKEEDQRKQRHAEHLKKLQQESLRELEKLLKYRFGDKQGSCYFSSVDVRDMHGSDSGIRIGILGPTGSGKSSFINTCERAIKLTTRGSCKTQIRGAEDTILVEDYLDDIEGCKFRLVDIRTPGFFGYSAHFHMHNAHVSESDIAISNIMYGRIRPSQIIDFTERADELSDSWDSDFPHWLHAVIFVLSVRDPRLLSGTHMINLNVIREFIRSRGMDPVCVLTHVDQVRDESQLDLIKTKASAATGSDPSHVYFIENYHPDHNERDFNIELRAMEILNSALMVGERYVRIHKRLVKLG